MREPGVTCLITPERMFTDVALAMCINLLRPVSCRVSSEVEHALNDDFVPFSNGSEETSAVELIFGEECVIYAKHPSKSSDALRSRRGCHLSEKEDSDGEAKLPA